MRWQTITIGEHYLPVNCQAPSMDEITKATNWLKNGKSDEPDGIPAEALKADDTTTTKILHPLFQKICAAKNRSDTVLYENLPCNMTIYHRKRILSFYNTI